MRIPGYKDWFLPLALVGFVGPTVTFLPHEVFEFARWAGAVVLLAYVLAVRVAVRAAKPSLLILIAMYVLWCLSTATWSPVPDLSLPKALALACVLPAFLLGGIDWAIRGQRDNVLGYLWPYAVVAAAAAVLGRAVALSGPDIELYQGAAGGPNVLGVLVASATPLVLWCLYRDWSRMRRRMLWLSMLSFYLAFLYLSNSRASYLLFAGIGFGYFVSLRPRAALPLLGITVAMILSVAVFAPDFAESLIERNVYKYADRERGAGVFANREREWAESYDAAVDGGWLGLGYGVSTGDTSFSGEYTSVGYGREKGNSQLAVIEETGIIGLALFLMLALVILIELWSAFRSCRDRDKRTQLGLLLGGFIGATLHGIFEAWWVAPGSVEFAYFWAVSGVALGLAQTIHSRRSDPIVAYRHRPLRA
jgi:O-antigen ligase